MLAGVRVEYGLGLAGHSDADAALHAVTDAILGALGADDIGEHFPDTDPQYSGADSRTFVIGAMEMAAERGYRVGNCDVTIIAERPRLGEYKPEMRRRLAELLRTGEDVVAVKAKTNECMGAIGRGEGVAAMAAVMLVSRD